jgi:asparagine synthase (glutamine-hydrolysing)
MCGFIGIISKSDKIEKKKFKVILDLIKHRGPDSQKIIFLKINSINVSLGFNRLSILDIHTRSDQPFIYKNLVIMFNGEIYNYKEIREHLETKKYIFRTEGDTEVFAACFDFYGIKCLDFFEGMFAFSVFDKKQNVFFLGRDRFGEKPLFYYFKNKEFYFSSEISPLIKMIPKIKLNAQKIYEYLFYNYRVRFKNSNSFFEDVNFIPSGSYIEFNLNNMNLIIRKFWNLKISNNDQRQEILEEEVSHLFFKSIKNTLNSDRKLCFLMSGGLDSNCIIGAAKTFLKNNLDCYTFIIPSKDYNELSNVKQISSYFKINSKLVNFPKNKNNNLDFLINVVSKRKSPLSTFTDLINNFLFKEISDQGYKVIISGNGSDEIFGGYISHYLMYLKELKKNHDNEFRTKLNFWVQNHLKYIRNKNFRNYKSFFKSSNSTKFYYENEFLYMSKMKKNLPVFEDFNKHQNGLKNLMYNDLIFNTVPLVCYEDDLNAMAYSIENRNPFLNHKLVEKVFSYNYKYLFSENTSKSILRRVCSRFLPSQLIDSKEKYGLNCKFEDAFDNKSEKLQYICNKDTLINDFIDKNLVKNLLSRSKRTPIEDALLFKYVNLQIFLDTYNNE